jgi:hypothetical protein
VLQGPTARLRSRARRGNALLVAGAELRALWRDDRCLRAGRPCRRLARALDIKGAEPETCGGRQQQPARWRVAAAGLLSSQTAQALRAELPSLIVWLAGTAAFAVIVGLISKSVAAAGSPDTSTGGR